MSNPQVDHIYALTAARIQFIPHQFKPLLRFLRADRPRLLIADDVGVGKTIEAGLVLKELSARQRLDRVLVMCPKALTSKWRAEMRRFDENFRVLSSETLRYCLDEVHDGGEWPAEYGRAIVHYELFRMDSYLHGAKVRGRRRFGLVELSPQFDLVIADEAHHLRTPGSNSHGLIQHLCQTSEAVLMLSATPVQVHSDNLFTLLHLLRPDLFPDKTTFQEVLAPNRHLTRAVRLLRNGSSAGEAGSPWGTPGPARRGMCPPAREFCW
ncbi:DEAD/DEAH box helicase [Actinomadura viridis]|uniref:SNF2 family DNA or RNA helicase n=1 Tax=Actinomadura viridis TaxID=58110 RepID=A0A931DMN7_9ACTN|nr:DEAD/DEAH box helicase [Actinomadura viridis]MBG6090421.1 SNF2 family DNA or RNA helicase [Actinomadura viridis]